MGQTTYPQNHQMKTAAPQQAIQLAKQTIELLVTASQE
jgi:hypothetical protein